MENLNQISIILLIIFVLSHSAAAQIEISEFMANPTGSAKADKPDGEWIELYNDGDEEINLTNYLIKDSEDENELYIEPEKILVDSLVLQSKSYLIVYRDGDSDFNLNDKGDGIRLFSEEGGLIDSVSYAQTSEGRTWSKVDGQWYETDPTPGSENVFVESCDIGLELGLDTTIFNESNMAFNVLAERLLGEKPEITVKGKIEDINGEIVKEYSPWKEKEISDDLSKSYSPRLKDGVYQLLFWLEDISCNDSNEENNNVTSLIAVNPEYKKNESSLVIEKVYLGNDNKAEWGDQVRVKINIYKADETKKTGQLWVEKGGEKIGKTTKISLPDKFHQYSLTVPVQLDSNCNNKIEDGKVDLVLEAFDLRVEKEFLIEGVDKDVCRDYLKELRKQERAKEKEEKKEPFEIVNFNPTINLAEVLPVSVKISSDGEHEFKVWSYVYRGSKCYSCNGRERDENAEVVFLDNNEERRVDFFLQLDETMEEGEYKLKVKVNKDNQKTDKEITKGIYVKAVEKVGEKSFEASEVTYVVSDGNQAGEGLETLATKQVYDSPGIVIYESNSQKAKKTIPYFLAITFGLMCIVLIRKR